MKTNKDVIRRQCRGFWSVAALVMLITGLGLGFDRPVFAQGGGVSVSPQRIVFEGRDRTAEVALINKSAKPVKYRIFFKNMRMKEIGGYEVITEPGPGDQFADKLIRYSPREITVPANSAQTVRLMLRKPRNLKEGEYRSHLAFQALPPPDAGSDIEKEALGEGQLSVRFIAMVSVSIPVIVRHGDNLSAQVAIGKMTLEPSESEEAPPQLAVQLTRQGNRSEFGDLTVTYQPASGEKVEVGLARGISIYVPNSSRTMKVPLKLPDGVQLKGGTLHTVYSARQDKGGGTLAKAELAVP